MADAVRPPRPWHRSLPEDDGQRPYEVMLRADGWPSGSPPAHTEKYHVAFVPLVVLACVVVMAVELYENGKGAAPGGTPTEDCALRLSLFCAASVTVNPYIGPSNDVLVQMGAKEAGRILRDGEVWRLVAPLFLHAGVVHLVLNMVALLQFGLRLEATFGGIRVGAIYLGSGVFGVVASSVLAPRAVGVGASGAICGLMGACLGEVMQNWSSYDDPARTCCSFFVVAFLQLALGTSPMVDNFQHVFGFCMGFVMALALLIRPLMGIHTQQPVSSKCRQHLLRVVAFSVMNLAFVAGILALFGGWDAYLICPACGRLACWPFPWGCRPSTPGECWWDCSPCSSGGLSSQISWTGSERNGSVTLRCPLHDVGGTYENVTVHSMDVSSFGRSALVRMCMDRCPADGF